MSFVGEFLFSAEKIKNLSKWSQIEACLKSSNVNARPLKISDHENGYLELLSQLTEVGQVSREDFAGRFNLMKEMNKVRDHYLIVVLEDLETKRIVGTSTLFLELKFIHECAVRGRLEDVAILESYRGRRLGETIVKIIVELAREVGKCYKLSLDCDEGLIKFYSLNNFNQGSVMRYMRF